MKAANRFSDEQTPDSQFYEFGPFVLDTVQHLLLKGQEPVALTPKTYDALLVLVRNGGRMLSKEELMGALWPDSFVEESNLTQQVSMIRKALGESPGDGLYIVTVPGRGYRFAAPVRARAEEKMRGISDRAQPELVSEKLDEANAAAGMEKLLHMEAHLPGRLVSASEVVQGPETEISTPAGKWRKAMIAAVIVVVGIAAIFAYLSYGKRSIVTPSAVGPRSVAILPFRNLQQDPNYEFLGFSLADAVITKLGYVSALSVRPSSDIEKYRDQTIDIQKVGRELNVDSLLIGNFIREGNDLRITSQLIDVRTHKILWRDTFDLKYEKLLSVQDEVAQQIIKGLALNLSAAETERLKPDEAVRPLAYEYYLRGVDLYWRHDFPLAIKMLEKSTEIDPNYSLTWAYLGASYTSDAAFEFGGREQYRRAQAAYERALAIQPTQLEARVFLANLLIDTGKVEQAVPLLREALKTNPNHAATHWELGYAYRFAGMLQESIAECERALQLDPLVKANGSVLNTYLYLGEYDKFLRSLPDGNGSAFVLFYRGLGEYYQKNWEQSAKDFDRAYEIDPTLYAQIGKAFSDAIGNKPADGLEILRGVEKKMGERGVGDAEAMYKIGQAYSVLGDKASGLRLLRRSIESGFFPHSYFLTDPLLDGLRQEAEFGQLMEIALQRHEAFKKNFF